MLTIISINYNGSENTMRLLRSLESQTDMEFKVIVVDNASKETDFNNLKKNIGNAELVRSNNNLGFSGGNNVGIKKALKDGANWVILLNNDTWVEKDFIARLRAILDQKQGIVGIPMIEGGGAAPSTPLRTSYCGKIEWLKPTLSHIYAEENYKQNSNSKSQTSNQPASHKLLATSYYVIGGAIAIHKNVFEKIGFLDANYFLYFEDADYTIRARRAGIPITIAPDVMIYHSVSSSAKKLGSPFLLRYHYRNTLYFNWKNGPWYVKFAVWPWSWWIVTKQALKVMIYHNREQSLAILSGVLDFYRHRMGQIKT